MFKINELVYMPAIRKKVMIIGANYYDGVITYICEDREENIYEVSYDKLVYLTHGY